MNTLLDKWEVAIATALRPLTDELELPIAALPLEANKFLVEQKELIDFLFSEVATIGNRSIGATDLKHTLIFRVYLTKRYPKDIGQKKAVSWVVAKLISQIDGLVLPCAYCPVVFERSRLFAPQSGSWYTEISFNVESSDIVLKEIE